MELSTEVHLLYQMGSEAGKSVGNVRRSETFEGGVVEEPRPACGQRGVGRVIKLATGAGERQGGRHRAEDANKEGDLGEALIGVRKNELRNELWEDKDKKVEEFSCETSFGDTWL